MAGETKRGPGRPPKIKDPMDTRERIAGASETKDAPTDVVGDYIYRSKNPFTISLQIPKDVPVRQTDGAHVMKTIQQKVRVRFDDSLHTLIVNQSLADSLEITVADINHYLRKWPSYNIGFTLVSGPGFKPSQAIIEFDRACQEVVAKKKGRRVIQGAKSSSNVT